MNLKKQDNQVIVEIEQGRFFELLENCEKLKKQYEEQKQVIEYLNAIIDEMAKQKEELI